MTSKNRTIGNKDFTFQIKMLRHCKILVIQNFEVEKSIRKHKLLQLVKFYYDHNETNGHTYCFSLISKYEIRLKAALLDIKNILR